MEIRKKVFIGETGNKAEVTEENRDPKSEEATYGKVLMREAGRLHRPIGYDHVGSAAIHYYEKKGLLGPEVIHVCQTDVRNVEEYHADLGWKALQTAFRQSYGRAEPKERT